MRSPDFFYGEEWRTADVWDPPITPVDTALQDSTPPQASRPTTPDTRQLLGRASRLEHYHYPISLEEALRASLLGGVGLNLTATPGVIRGEVIEGEQPAIEPGPQQPQQGEEQ